MTYKSQSIKLGQYKNLLCFDGLTTSMCIFFLYQKPIGSIN